MMLNIFSLFLTRVFYRLRCQEVLLYVGSFFPLTAPCGLKWLMIVTSVRGLIACSQLLCMTFILGISSRMIVNREMKLDLAVHLWSVWASLYAM